MKVGDKIRPAVQWRGAYVKRDDGSKYQLDEDSCALCLQAPKDATGGILILLLDDMTERVSLCERWDVVPTDEH